MDNFIEFRSIEQFTEIKGILKDTEGDKSITGELFLIELIRRALFLLVEDMINTGNHWEYRKRSINGNEEIHDLVFWRWILHDVSFNSLRNFVRGLFS